MRKYHFQCLNCGEGFNVRSEFLVEKDSLVCPNCSAKLPDSTFELLKKAATSLRDYDSKNPDAQRSENYNYFSVSIQ